MRSFLLAILCMCPLVVKTDNFNSAMLYKNGVVSQLNVPCDGPSDIAIQGNLAYICNRYAPSVSILDLTTNTIVKTIEDPIIQQPYNITVSGDYAYVTELYPNVVYAINLTNETVTDYVAALNFDYAFDKIRPLVFGNDLYLLGTNVIDPDATYPVLLKLDISNPGSPGFLKELNLAFNTNGVNINGASTTTISKDGTKIYLGGSGTSDVDPDKYLPFVISVSSDLVVNNTSCSESIAPSSTVGALIYVSDDKIYGCSNYQNVVNYPNFTVNPIVVVDVENGVWFEVPQNFSNLSAVLKNNKTRTFQNKFNSLSSLGQEELYLNSSSLLQPTYYSGYAMVYDDVKKVVYVANLGPKFVTYGNSPLCAGKDSMKLSWNPSSLGGGGQGDNVLLIDTNTNRIVGNIKGFNSPQAMALKSDGSLYVCDGSVGSLYCGTLPLQGKIKKVK